MSLSITTRFTILLLGTALHPAHGQGAPKLTSFNLEPGVEVRLAYSDDEPGGVSYLLECSDDMKMWETISSDLPDVLGLGSYDMSAPMSDTEDQKFYRVRAVRKTATLGFEFSDEEVSEGSGAKNIGVRFLDADGNPLIYNGPISYQWSGAEGLVGQLTGTVLAGGAGATIPLEILDNAGTESLRQLTLKLVAGGAGGYSVDPASSTSTLTIRENDNYWRGGFVTDSGSIDLEIYIRRDNGTLLVFLTDGTELLPDDGLSITTGAILTDTDFHVSFPATDVSSTLGNLVAAGTQIELILDASTGVPGHKVSRDELAGSGTLVLRNTLKPHLTTTVEGTFLIRQDPPLQPAQDLILE